MPAVTGMKQVWYRLFASSICTVRNVLRKTNSIGLGRYRGLNLWARRVIYPLRLRGLTYEDSLDF